MEESMWIPRSAKTTNKKKSNTRLRYHIHMNETVSRNATIDRFRIWFALKVLALVFLKVFFAMLAHVKIRLPHSALEKKTSYKAYYGNKPTSDILDTLVKPHMSSVRQKQERQELSCLEAQKKEWVVGSEKPSMSTDYTTQPESK